MIKIGARYSATVRNEIILVIDIYNGEAIHFSSNKRMGTQVETYPASMFLKFYKEI